MIKKLLLEGAGGAIALDSSNRMSMKVIAWLIQ
jgi:hypothetical protein